MEGAVPNYLMGHSEWELGRLSRQARVIDPITRRGFEAAGLGEGMRVLDVGSGVGDVAFLAASIVGPNGSVLGADRSAVALEVARRRVVESGMHNIRFIEADPAMASFDEPFDAVVGRYVLMFQEDPASMLRALSRHVRPGGLLAFHEPDWSGARSHPTCPTYDHWCGRIAELVIRAGSRDRMGVELTSAFIQAGLPAPNLEVGELIGGAATAEDAARLVAELVVTLMPEMVRHGVVDAPEQDPEKLFGLIMDEAISQQAVLVGRSEIIGWCRP